MVCLSLLRVCCSNRSAQAIYFSPVFSSKGAAGPTPAGKSHTPSLSFCRKDKDEQAEAAAAASAGSVNCAAPRRRNCWMDATFARYDLFALTPLSVLTVLAAALLFTVRYLFLRAAPF